MPPARPAQPARTELLQTGWSYVDKPTLDDLTVEDWDIINRQRAVYFAENTATRALQLLATLREAPSFGYETNTYMHCLNAASMALRNGLDAESVVAILFHDVFLEVSDANHGQAVSELLRPYVSDRWYWILKHHGLFINLHCPTYPGIDINARERWRGHEHFSATAHFVEHYDQVAIRADAEILELSAFEPLVRQVFAQPKHARRKPE
jgi:predicted HD phosphohydrolase